MPAADSCAIDVRAVDEWAVDECVLHARSRLMVAPVALTPLDLHPQDRAVRRAPLDLALFDEFEADWAARAAHERGL